MMTQPTSTSTLSTIERFFRSNFDYDIAISSANEIVRMVKDDFTVRLAKLVGDEVKHKDKKEKLNALRVKLATFVINKFDIKTDISIINRTNVGMMANDIWFLVNSVVDSKLSTDSKSIIKKKNGQMNDSIVGDNSNKESSDLKKLIENICSDVKDLKKLVEELKTENCQLKKVINDQFRLKNFNLLENCSNNVEVNGTTSREDAGTQPTSGDNYNSYKSIVANGKPVQQSNQKKKKFLVGSQTFTSLKGASKLFDYYTGFWSVDCSKDDVRDYINKFAFVEEINQLDTKHKYYNSFHIRVKSTFSDKILDRDNWPMGVKIKRYFEPRTKQANNHDNEVDNSATKSNNSSENRNYQRGGFRYVRGGANSRPNSSSRAEVAKSDNQSNSLDQVNKRKQGDRGETSDDSLMEVAAKKASQDDQEEEDNVEMGENQNGFYNTNNKL